MTTLLQRAVAEAEKRPVEDQDAIASRFLAEVEDERQWNSRFVATTGDQWDRLVAVVRARDTEEHLPAGRLERVSAEGR